MSTHLSDSPLWARVILLCVILLKVGLPALLTDRGLGDTGDNQAELKYVILAKHEEKNLPCIINHMVIELTLSVRQ